ncbi:MAG: tail fiber domain-containing protein [Cytophagales bacterium]
MKKIYLLLVLVHLAFLADAQNNTGIGTTTPNPNALLELDNNGSPLGLLLPRQDISTFTLGLADSGMMVYNTVDDKIYIWNGSAWVSATSEWGVNGTDIFNLNTGNVGIGISTPAYKLTVVDNIAGSIAGLNSSGSNTLMDFNNAGVNPANWTFGYLGNTGGNPGFMTFLRGSHRFVVTNNGDVGIAETNPQARLEITGSGNSSASHSLLINNATPTNMFSVRDDGRVGIGVANPGGALEIANAEWASNPVILNTTGAVGPTIRFNNPLGRIYDLIGSTGTGASTGTGHFGLYDNTSFAYRFIVSPTGNFGIGTITTANRLDVEGGAAIGSNYSGTITSPIDGMIVEGQVGIGTSSPVATNKLHVLTPAGTLERYTINAENVYDGASLGIGVWSYMRGSGSGNAYAFYASNSSSTSGLEYGFYSSGEDYNYFSGNVGIQTTIPGYDLTLGATGQVFAVENTGTFVARNSGGTYENYFWPRWSDNIMYMNYGSGGFHIRNNSSATTMFMTNDNRIGVGTTNPSVTGDFHVSGDDYVVDGNQFYGTWWVTGGTIQAHMHRWGASNNALYVTNAGGSDLTGVFLASGGTSWTSSSDRRMKENIVESSYGINEILQLSVKEYNFKTTAEKDKKIGLIAQDVYNVIPEIVQKGDNGAFRGEGNAELSTELGFEPWGINYTELVPVLVKALQELNSKNEELQKRIEFLESK